MSIASIDAIAVTLWAGVVAAVIFEVQRRKGRRF